MKKHGLAKGLSLLLVLCLMLSLVPVTALAEELEETTPVVEETTPVVEETAEEKTVEEEKTAATVQDKVSDSSFEMLDWVVGDWTIESTDLAVDTTEGATQEVKARDVSDDDFYRIFHLDCGRKYFTVDQVKALIDVLAANGYNYLELAIGNDGLRLLLDDMSVTVGSKTYSSANVTAGIKAGNAAYSHSGEWTQSEMNSIIAYADSKNVEIIPLVNTPGHMDAIIDAMEYVGISSPAYNNSARTVDVTNEEAIAFTQALVQKYAEYFAGKGSTMFHMGADEYANDVYTSGSMGFGQLQSSGEYGAYITYINEMAAIIKAAGMTPMAFNDGIYFNNVTASGTFDSDILVTYWTSGWGTYVTASASTLADKGHRIVNTNDGWYYVLGRASGTYGYSGALSNAQSLDCMDIPGSSDPTAVGAMQCLWCDTPSVTYDDAAAEDVYALIEALAATNKDVYVVAETGVEDITGIPSAAMQVGETATLSVPENATWTSSNEDVVVLTSTSRAVTSTSVTAEAVGAGTATITATGDSGTVYSGDIAVAAAENEKTITVAVGGSTTVTVEGDLTSSVDKTELNESVASVSAVYENTPGGTTTSKVSSLTSGTEIVIGDGNGNYLKLDGTTLDVTSDPAEATVWTVSGSDNQWYLKSGNYYLRHSNNNLSASTNNYSSTWRYDGSKLYYTTSSGGFGSTTYRFYYSNGWKLSSDNVSSSSCAVAYTVTTTEATSGTTITFAGKEIGTTYVTVGDTRYTIKVTDAPPADAMTSSTLTLEQWITNIHAVTTSGGSAYTQTISSSNASTAEGIALNTVAPENTYWSEGMLYYWQSVRLDADNNQTLTGGDDETGDGVTITHVRYYNGAWQYKSADGTWSYFVEGDQLVAYYLQKTEVTAEIDTYSKDWGFDPGDGDGNKQIALSIAVVYPDGTVSPAESDIFLNSSIMFNYWEDRNIGIVAPTNNSDYDIAKITVTHSESISNRGSSNTWSENSVINWKKVENDAGVMWYDETTYWDDSMDTAPMVNGTIEGIVWPAENTAILVLIYLEAVEKESNLTVNWVDDSAGGALIHTIPVVVKSTGEVTFYNGLVQDSALPAAGVGGTFTLDDDAYITNSSNVNQTFNKEISIIPGVAAQYTSGLYKYVSADLSADGKTLTLHYNLDASKLSMSYVVDFGLPVSVPLSALVENAGNVSSVEIVKGSATVGSDNSVVFTPAGVMTGIQTVTVKVNWTSSSENFTIAFIPATTVYYEEGFAGIGGSKGTMNQSLSLPGSGDHYGYQAGYSNETSAAVDAGDSITFTGTGIEIYTTDVTASSGQTLVTLKQNGTMVKAMFVDTAMKAGVDESTTGSQNGITAYNVPIVSIRGLTYGTYTVAFATVTGTVELDGFRVHGTMGTSGDSTYMEDNEQSPIFTELRDVVLGSIGVTAETSSDKLYAKQIANNVMSQIMAEYDTTSGAIVVSKSGVVTQVVAQDLLDNGPKNELYLAPGQAVAFNVANYSNVQVGLKALNATGLTCQVNGTNTAVTNVDMFYETGSSVTITNPAGSGAILSVTLVKAAGNAALSASEIQFAALTEEDLTVALLSLGFEEEPVEEETPDVEVPETPDEDEDDAPAKPVKPSKPNHDYGKIFNKIQKVLKRFFR